MFHSLKDKFQLVQDGISAGFRSLKIKEDKFGNETVSPVNFNAGAEIVLKNEQEWTSIRTTFGEIARKAEMIDQKIDEIYVEMNKRLHTMQEITNFTNGLPRFTKKIESVSNNLASIETMATEAENILLILEDLIEIEEQKQRITNEKFRHALYIEDKTREIEFIKSQLDKQYNEKASLKEKQIQETLKERQELFNMAFQQDLQLYKESGIVPMNVRGAEGSSTLSLEDVVIEDDMQGLNELLNS